MDREPSPHGDCSDSDNLIRRDAPRRVDREQMNKPKTSRDGCNFGSRCAAIFAGDLDSGSNFDLASRIREPAGRRF